MYVETVIKIRNIPCLIIIGFQNVADVNLQIKMNKHYFSLIALNNTTLNGPAHLIYVFNHLYLKLLAFK